MSRKKKVKLPPTNPLPSSDDGPPPTCPLSKKQQPEVESSSNSPKPPPPKAASSSSSSDEDGEEAESSEFESEPESPSHPEKLPHSLSSPPPPPTVAADDEEESLEPYTSSDDEEESLEPSHSSDDNEEESLSGLEEPPRKRKLGDAHLVGSPLQGNAVVENGDVDRKNMIPRKRSKAETGTPSPRNVPPSNPDMRLIIEKIEEEGLSPAKVHLLKRTLALANPVQIAGFGERSRQLKLDEFNLCARRAKLISDVLKSALKALSNRSLCD